MRKIIIAVLLPVLAFTFAIAFGQTPTQTVTPEPTQTPYIVYIVVTATPEPEVIEEPIIKHPDPTDTVSLANGQGSGDSVTLVNQTSPAAAGSTEELIQRVVATVMAQTGTTAGGSSAPVQNTAPAGGALVHQSDGTTCTMNFDLISEPSYPAGSIIPRGEVFWKEWVIRNTGTCTWTQDWEFVFDSGWQIGNTRFSMKRNTAPGETLTVRLAMVPDQKQDGNYYSTYIFEAPDGTRYGKITSSYTVKAASYFSPTPTLSPWCPTPCWPCDPWDPWCPYPGLPYPPPRW